MEFTSKKSLYIDCNCDIFFLSNNSKISKSWQKYSTMNMCHESSISTCVICEHIAITKCGLNLLSLLLICNQPHFRAVLLWFCYTWYTMSCEARVVFLVALSSVFSADRQARGSFTCPSPSAINNIEISVNVHLIFTFLNQ